MKWKNAAWPALAAVLLWPGLPCRAAYNKDKVLAYMLHDKKARGDRITLVKVPGLGCWRLDKVPLS